ncbi:MAG: gluconolaconase [Paucibacter sp.]|nr:gluconolaconase [Roseateles sp.]
MKWIALMACALLAACHEAPLPAAAPTAASSPPQTPPAPPALPASAAQVQLLSGDGTPAQLVDPYGLAFGPDGTLFVADDQRIWRIAPDGKRSVFVESPELASASGIAVDTQGAVIVADTGHHRILRVAPGGVISVLAGSGKPGWRDGLAKEARFDMPMAVALDLDGNVIVADSFNDRIRRISPTGRVSTLTGGGHPDWKDGSGELARLDTPMDVAVDHEGNVWIADTGNDALRKLTPQGDLITVLRPDPKDTNADLRHPLALALAPDGRVFIAVAARGRVLAVGADGVLVRVLDAQGPRLARPAALAIDPLHMRLAVSDAAGHRVHEIVEHARDTTQGPAPDAPLPDTHGRWPLAPQRSMHEVVGTLGEVRATHHEKLDHLHAGLDVRGDVGEPVLAIAEGKVLSPLAASGFGNIGEALNIGDLGYVHVRVGRSAGGLPFDPKRFIAVRDERGRLLRVRVRRGTVFKPGDVLGTINPMAHVHLQLGAPGAQRNPLALNFIGFADHVPPQIERVEIKGGELQVEGWDQVDGNEERRRLGLYSLSWQLLNAQGQPLPGLEQPREALRFDRLPPDEDAVERFYTPASGITIQGSKVTRFVYRLGMLPPLPAGRYRVRVTGADYSGNVARKDLEFSVN